MRRAETLVWSREELFGWWGWLKRHLAAADAFRHGIHCGRCPRAMECPAHLRQTWAMARAFSDVEEPLVGGIDEMTPANLLDAYRFAALVAKRCEEFREATKALVTARGGRVGRLSLAEKETRNIDTGRAWETLRAVAPDDQALADMLKVRKGEMESMVRATAPRRGGAAAVRDLYDRLEAAGAIERSTSYQLEVLNGDSDTTATGAGERQTATAGAEDDRAGA
jgi:hypothetical protein